MTKSQLIEIIAAKQNISNTKAGQFVDAILAEMQQALCAGDRIEFRGFGSFSIKEHEAYQARNPRTGERVQVPIRKRVRFRMSDLILKRLNDSFLD